MAYERTEVEKLVRKLIALDSLYKPFSGLGDRGKRRAEALVLEISDLVQRGESSDNERVYAKLETSEESAREIREAIEAFKKKATRKYGPQIVDEIEQEVTRARTKNRVDLIFRLGEGYTLGEEELVAVMMDLGFDRRAASALYPHILEAGEKIIRESRNKYVRALVDVPLAERERKMLVPRKKKSKK